MIILAINFSFLTFVIQRSLAAKVFYIEGCFGCLWKAKDDNIDLKASFDSFIVIRTRFSIVGTKCPTPSGNVIPEPVRNRVKVIIKCP